MHRRGKRYMKVLRIGSRHRVSDIDLYGARISCIAHMVGPVNGSLVSEVSETLKLTPNDTFFGEPTAYPEHYVGSNIAIALLIDVNNLIKEKIPVRRYANSRIERLRFEGLTDRTFYGWAFREDTR